MADGGYTIDVKIEDRGVAGEVAYVTYDRSRKLNALNTPALKELAARFRRLAGDARLRCVVFHGAGKGWIGGADIAEMAVMTPESGRAFITHVHGLCDALRNLPVPTIAAINGYCLGAGLEAAAACDMRIAVDSAMLGMPEVKVGVPSVVEAALLPRLIGWGRTSELLLGGENITAHVAERWGLVEEVVPADALDRAVARRVDAIVANAPLAVRAQKALMRRWEELPLRDAIRAGIDAFEESCRTGEHLERMGAFVKRKGA